MPPSRHEKALRANYQKFNELLHLEDKVLKYLVSKAILLEKRATALGKIEDREVQNTQFYDDLSHSGESGLIELVRGLLLCADGSPNRQLARKIQLELTRKDREEIEKVPVTVIWEQGEDSRLDPQSCTVTLTLESPSSSQNGKLLWSEEFDHFRSEFPIRVGAYSNCTLTVATGSKQETYSVEGFEVWYDTPKVVLDTTLAATDQGQERRQEKCEDQVMHPDSNQTSRERLSGIIPAAASQPHVDAAGQQSGSTASTCTNPSTKQPPQSHEEAHNYQQDPEDPDHRRYVRKQARKRHHKNIFHLDILKECCRDDKDTDGRGTSYGTCFLAKMTLPADSAANGRVHVNSDPPPRTATAPLYLLTAGHSLFCRKHGKYASEINLVSVSPGNIEKRKLLTEPLLSKKSDEAYFKVPLLYQNADGNHDAQLYDVGVICVPRRLFDDAALSSALLNVNDIALRVPQPSASKPRYRRGFVCGYPNFVWTPHDVDVNIPPDEYNDNCQTIWNGRTGVKMDKHLVAGALYEVPAEKSLKASSSSEFVDSKMERQTAGIFPFPQPEDHFDQAGIKVEDVDYLIPACKKTLVRHYIDTSGGQSGSPAYVDGDGKEREVIGIHIGVWYFTRGEDGKAEHNPQVDCNVLVQLNSTILAEVAKLITPRPTPSHNETGEYHEAQPSPVPHPSAVLPYEDEEKSTSLWQSLRLRSNPAASGSRHGDIGASSHASRVGETGLATGGVQGQMSGASADFPQSGQHGQVAVSASSLPSSTAQPATAVPAARSGNPWKSSEYDKMFKWLVENMEPRAVRSSFKTLLNTHQMESLKRINDDKFGHNETILGYLETHSWESYEIFVRFLTEQKGEEYAKRTQILKTAAGLL